jgi:hypothetical protein
MISMQLARALHDSGLVWRPQRGDNFRIDRIEADEEVYTLSDMTVEAHTFTTGTVLGFNGTTEWALDSVALDDALWLPREDQLRDILKLAFDRLERRGDAWTVTARIEGESREFAADDAADAYARALLALLDTVTGESLPLE